MYKVKCPLLWLRIRGASDSQNIKTQAEHLPSLSALPLVPHSDPQLCIQNAIVELLVFSYLARLGAICQAAGSGE